MGADYAIGADIGSGSAPTNPRFRPRADIHLWRALFPRASFGEVQWQSWLP